MAEHSIRTMMTLPLDIVKVFSFFADAASLEAITPPEPGFQILPPVPTEIRAGTTIDYRLRLFGVPLRWRTLISTWAPPHRFVDEQLEGSYRRWVHEHSFRELDGRIEIADRVSCALPLWPLGEAAYPLVRAHLARIFRYRQRVISDELLSAGRSAA